MIRFGGAVERIDKRMPGIDLPLMSVSQTRGVVRRSELTDKEPRADSLDVYKVCRRNDIVFNKMSVGVGAMGVAREDGLVTYHYEVMRPRLGTDPRYIVYLMKSSWFTGEMLARERGIAAGSSGGGVRTTEIPFSVLRTIAAPIPEAEDQQRIADFLDDQVSRIDEIICLRREQAGALEERLDSHVFGTICGASLPGPRRDSGLEWLGVIPDDWLVATTGSQFTIMLGKMLNEERSRGDTLRPYLRNANVQWGRIDVSDLAAMNFPASERRRYEVLPGDLLICEGGQPGRAAVWDGSLDEIYYQKALHRARPRAGSDVRWLFYLLRAAVQLNVFGTQGNQATIPHLTGEQLSAQRFPFPSRSVQVRLIESLDEEAVAMTAAQKEVHSQIDLLQERKRSLITAAVTGEFDVTTASGRGVA